MGNDFNVVEELFGITESAISYFIKDIKASRHFFKERSLAKDVSTKEENDIFLATWIFMLFELEKILSLYKQKKKKDILELFKTKIIHSTSVATGVQEGNVRKNFINLFNTETNKYSDIIKESEDYKKLFHEFLSNLHEDKKDFIDNIATDIGFFEGAYLWVMDYRVVLKHLCHGIDDITKLNKDEFEARLHRSKKDTKKIAEQIKKM